MKIKLIFSLILITSSLCAQILGTAGHFVNTDNLDQKYNIVQNSKRSSILIDNHVFEGNAGFKTAHGYVTVSSNYENAPSILKIFSNEGKELFNQTFKQSINFTLSPNQNFCAFHDMQKIWVIDIAARTTASFDGSNIFALNEEGKVAFYNEKTSSVVFDIFNISVNEPIYRILFFNKQPLFVSKNKIFQIINNTLIPVFTTNDGRIFDVMISSGELWLSLKRQMPGEFIFTALSSTDLITFVASGEEVHYPLASSSYKKKDQKKRISANKSLLPNETIRDPLDYYKDTVYQSVGNSYDEIQEYISGAPYPHPGVDLMGTYQQSVYSVKKGYVKAVLTTSWVYHWRIAISNTETSNYSQGYLYAHLDEASIPYTVGDSVDEGDVLGHLVNFPNFVHCHFARIGCMGTVWNGDWLTYDNPLCYMSNFFDTIPPTFETSINKDLFAFRDFNGNYLSPDSLFGGVKVISKVYDRINSDWHCDVNRLSYSVSPLSKPKTILIDTLSFDYHYYNDQYYITPMLAPGIIKTIYSRDFKCYSTADYDTREFYHIITNSDGNDTINENDTIHVFDTKKLVDGSYIFRITAIDPSGNKTIDSMVIKVKNQSVGITENKDQLQLKIFPNPFVEETILQASEPLNNAILKLYNSLGQEVRQIEDISGTNIKFQRGNLPEGLYLIKLIQNNKVFVSDKLLIKN